MPLLHVERYGHVRDEEIRNITTLLEECYSRLQPSHLDLVEILIFENNSLWRVHTLSQRKKARVASAEFDDAFIAAHEAWSGIPRISISLKRKQDLPQLVWEGALRHEAGHSVLHGSVEYYTFPIPKALQKAGEDFPKLSSHLADILYLISLTVKDIEVTRLLASNGYVEDQVAYARFTMRVDEQDLNAWSLASFAAEARVLCLIGRLKDIAAGTALAAKFPDPCIDPEEVDESIGYLTRSLRKSLYDILLEMSRGVGHDTFASIEKAGTLVVANIIEPVMSDPSLAKAR